jgi:LPXTG-site transpeptidase (sortase) family protein
LNSFNKIQVNSQIGESYQFTNEIASNLENDTTNFNIQDETEEVSVWKLSIPKINLEADISEGTDKSVLDEYIGHFENTQKENGNVGLAAHNRGYNVNYFSRLKELEVGDEIIYTYNENQKKYKVESKSIINDTDWSKLENTEDNKLTLITCVENKPELRRCIQAIEE